MAKSSPPNSSEVAAPLGLPLAGFPAIVRMAQLTKVIGISRSMIYLKINDKSPYYDPKFPKPRKLGTKAVGWLLSDVATYVGSLEGK